MSSSLSRETNAAAADGRRHQAAVAALIPNVRHRSKMLADLGLSTIDGLFTDIPADVQIKGLKLPPPRSEADVVGHLAALAARNQTGRLGGGGMPVFLGTGLKERYIPAPVRALALRSEFYTSYTPYQPEVSQGMLQALFEFQSMVCELTGMPVANASQYDGATAIGEAALMCARAGPGKRLIVPEALTRSKRSLIENYTRGAGLVLETVPFDRDTGTLDMAALESMLGPDVAGLFVETPNLFGLWEPEAHRLKALLEDKEAGLLVVGADPLSLALAKGPGEYGADVVVGELGGFGVPPSYGGPLVGYLATTEKLVRKMPGRVVGLTTDSRGRHGFTLTLQAREQHIRRERAMSNICTNQTLAAVAASIHLAVLGGAGLADLALRNESRAKALARRLAEIPGVTLPFSGPAFEEFTLSFDRAYAHVHSGLLARNVHGGYDLGGRFEGLPDAAVFATTEVHGDDDHQALARALAEVCAA